jgi:hypothetical protein
MESKRIRARFGDLAVEAVLNESRTARRLWEVLPFDSRAKRWGDEVYFETPLEAGGEEPQAEVPSAPSPAAGRASLFFGGPDR